MIKNLLNKRKYITVSSVELNDTELNEDENQIYPLVCGASVKSVQKSYILKI